jgi:hypothetical protein
LPETLLWQRFRQAGGRVVEHGMRNASHHWIPQSRTEIDGLVLALAPDDR